MSNHKLELVLIICIFLLISLGVYSNVRQQTTIDKSKLASEVENSKGFQRWITNLKNNDLDVSGDDFRLLEENEIYNTKWTKVTSLTEGTNRQLFDKTLRDNVNIKKVVFSPSKQAFIDYRQPTQVRFYGLREGKIVDSRLIECVPSINCYVDRAYFITDDTLVVSEISRNIDKDDKTAPSCTLDQTCTYTFKVHVINLATNSRGIYESNPIEAVLSTLAPEL